MLTPGMWAARGDFLPKSTIWKDGGGGGGEELRSGGGDFRVQKLDKTTSAG